MDHRTSQICLLGVAVSDNSTIDDHSAIEDVSEVANVPNNLDVVDTIDQELRWWNIETATKMQAETLQGKTLEYQIQSLQFSEPPPPPPPPPPPLPVAAAAATTTRTGNSWFVQTTKRS
ncbi:hypothetical protein M0802_012857 [Mischocyttarus mexicanus]|nr:hypothetical protein M0802_012857 [Mischocyttarus mexicanus]